jgi:hypothetical protein
VSHGDPIIHGNGVELDPIPAVGVDNFFDLLTNVMQMDMTGHKLGERIRDGNNGLAKVLGFHAGSSPQGPGSGHPSTLSSNAAAESALLHE